MNHTKNHQLFQTILDKLKHKLKQYKMATSQELYQQMKDLWETFEEEHNGDTKASSTRARKAVGELKKLVTEYRKASVAENK